VQSDDVNPATTAWFQITPTYQLTVTSSASTILAGGAGPSSSTQITAVVTDPFGNPVPGVSVTVTATSDGNPALAQVTFPGQTGQAVVSDADGYVIGTLTSGQGEEYPKVTATATAPDGTTIAATTYVSCLRAEFDVELGPWQAGPSGTFTATAAITASYDGVPVTGRPISLTGEVTVNPDDGDIAPGYDNALSFANVSGVTDGNGTFTTTVTWNPSSTPQPTATPDNFGIMVYVTDGLVPDPNASFLSK
jgi:hypothetical protein